MARYVDVEGYRKLFDAEYKKTRALIRQGETHLDNLAEGFSEAGRVIDNMPTADVVEVVRCKDCVNYCGFEHCKNGICDVDSVSKRAVYPNDYCSYGERRDT